MPARSKSKPASKISGPLLRRMRRVKLFLCDVDGVLTDASVFIGAGIEIKRFHIQDGLGLRLLQKNGIRVGWVSNRPSTATTERATELKVDFLYQDKTSKVDAVETILREARVQWDEVCYVGDDVVDLGVLRRAGLAVSVANGIEEARRQAHYVTRAEGGHGAVREIVTLLLKAQGKWNKIVREYSS